MERYDLYVDDHQAARALDRAHALRAAETALLQMGRPDTERAEVCIRIAGTDELRAVWYWTAAGWQNHCAEGWT